MENDHIIHNQTASKIKTLPKQDLRRRQFFVILFLLIIILILRISLPLPLQGEQPLSSLLRCFLQSSYFLLVPHGFCFEDLRCDELLEDVKERSLFTIGVRVRAFVDAGNPLLLNVVIESFVAMLS